MATTASSRPIVHLYSICWNEEYLLPYFFRHYDEFVDRYVFYDDGSTDSTLEILSSHPAVEIRPLPRLAVDSYVLAAQKVHEECWQESRAAADWVIITAVDELLYTPHMAGYLRRCTERGITAIPALGYEMISETVPQGDASLLQLARRGAPWAEMNKLSIFAPAEIVATNQAVGRHSARPVGTVVYPQRDEVLLLHYRWLSFDRTYRRNQELNRKLGDFDRQKGWGHQYGWPPERLRERWNSLMQSSVEDVFLAPYDPARQHSANANCWWRPVAPVGETQPRSTRGETADHGH